MQRVEGLAKLTGAERYLDDLDIEGCWWGMTVRSPAPRGRIREIRYGKAVDWSEIVVVDHRDIPGANEVFLIENDQPVLAANEVRHVHEAVVLLAHPSRDVVRRAVQDVEVIVDPAPAVLDFRSPPAADQVQRGSDNVLSRLRIVKGDVERALAGAPHVIEGIYETGAQEHVYLENQAMAAWVENGVVVVTGSMQCPYYVLNALKHALGRDETGVRVVHAPTGGGFGGKEDYPSILGTHVALLALKAGRPVKIVYDRAEDMAATTKRHPARLRHRTGVDATGRLLAQDIKVELDGGAYVTLSPVVLSRAIIHAAGPYACENVRIRGRAMLTNAVPFGAFRGFGAPQTQFANERHMDVIARTLGLDPRDVRRVNLIQEGQTTSTGQVIRDGADRIAVLDRAVEMASYDERRAAHRVHNASHPYLRRGMGLVTFYHGAGFTGAGEVYLASRLRIAGHPDGRVELLSAQTEMGQGTTTIFTQIAADRLGYRPDDVIVATADTARVPNSGPTVASRTAMVVGRMIERACDALCEAVGIAPHAPNAPGAPGAPNADGAALRAAIIDWHRANPAAALERDVEYEKPPNITWNDATYTGDAYGAFAWAAYIAEVEIDLRTYDTRVSDFVAVQEVGKVLNPVLARGQIQGGIAQGIGWALMEDCRWRDGAMCNNQLTNYIIPTSGDLPPIRVDFLESPYADGAQGAKGIGELPLDGAAPAVLNAVADALGVDPCSVPLTPEVLMEVMDRAESG